MLRISLRYRLASALGIQLRPVPTQVGVDEAVATQLMCNPVLRSTTVGATSGDRRDRRACHP